jgi:hypothetical protein
MSNEIMLGQKVRLKSFNGLATPPDGCRNSENYWRLIGYSGVVVEPKNDRCRLLVQFEESIEALGLHCHNPIENSLYILESDLTLLA